MLWDYPLPPPQALSSISKEVPDKESVDTLVSLINTVEPNSLIIALVVKQLYKLEEFSSVVRLIESIPPR
jgi:hypothetical protein